MSSLDSQPLHNFIETYDTPQVWKDNICESIISFFEKKYIPKSSGLKAFNRNRQKVCSTITFNFGEDWEINDSVYFFVREGIDKYRNKYVKLIVVNKNDLYKFDKFTDRLLKADSHEVKIIEDFSDLDANTVSDDIVENTQDTMTLLGKYIDDLDIKLEKSKLKGDISKLYHEAQDLEL